MKQNWTYYNIFTLEYFCHQDADKNPELLHKRDRAIFLESVDKSGTEDQKKTLYHWLQTRKRDEFSSKTIRSPGNIIQESYGLLNLLLPSLGLLCGLLSGLAFFTYSGTTPVNVFHFLVLFVFSQLAMLLVLLFTMVLRLSGVRQAIPSILPQVYGLLIARFGTWLQHRVMKNLAADKRGSYEQAIGLSKKAGRTYGFLLYWPLFTLSQLVLVSLNIGLLAATLFRVTTSDIAFGWQSTIQFSATAIHQGVRILALPWSWLVSETSSYPSLQEIEGSRIILKDGIYHLATQDLISWWPFLIFCLLVYGFLLRLLLVLLGKYMQYRSLRKLELNTPDCLRIIRRMQTPLVSTQAAPRKYSKDEQAPETGAIQTAEANRITTYPLMVLIPDDISQQCRPKDIVPLLQHHGFTFDHHEIFMRDYESDRSLLQQLNETDWQDKTGVLVMMEAWMPLIRDFLSFLKELRRVTGVKTPLFIGLIGKSQQDSPFSPAKTHDIKVWRQKLDGLGDPYLNVLELVGKNDSKAD